MRLCKKYISIIIATSFFMITLILILLFKGKAFGNNEDSFVYATDNKTIQEGKLGFMQNCASCHGLEADGFGPRLGGITKLFSDKKLKEMIKNMPLLIESGDERCNLLKAKYKQVMPPFTFLDDDQISSILSYINYQTDSLKLKAMQVVKDSIRITKKLTKPIQKTGLNIEIEDFIKMPRSSERPGDKGLATFRIHPLLKGAYFVSDQMGIIYKISNKKEIDTFLNVTSYLKNFIYEPGIGSGLGSFVLHPEFPSNGLIYTTHTEEYLKKPAINDGDFPESIGVGLQWVLSEWKLNDIMANKFSGERREVLRLNTPTTAHGVQDIGFAPVVKNNPDYGLLYIGIGDGGSNNIKMPELLHHNKSILGSILRINPTGSNSKTGNYGIPSDNPFVNETDKKVKKEVYAFGFRNPHRMCWDMTYGKRMIVADIGQANIEEINIVENGGDYGWSDMEGTFGISIKKSLSNVYNVTDATKNKHKMPFGEYDHQDGTAISGGFVYHGVIKELQNKYIFGDIATGRLLYMNMNKAISDSTIYDLTLVKNGKTTSLRELTNAYRVHLRIGYDESIGDLFIMTKGDGMIRKITNAFIDKNQAQ